MGKMRGSTCGVEGSFYCLVEVTAVCLICDLSLCLSSQKLECAHQEAT